MLHQPQVGLEPEITNLLAQMSRALKTALPVLADNHIKINIVEKKYTKKEFDMSLGDSLGISNTVNKNYYY